MGCSFVNNDYITALKLFMRDLVAADGQDENGCNLKSLAVFCPRASEKSI